MQKWETGQSTDVKLKDVVLSNAPMHLWFIFIHKGEAPEHFTYPIQSRAGVSQPQQQVDNDENNAGCYFFYLFNLTSSFQAVLAYSKDLLMVSVPQRLPLMERPRKIKLQNTHLSLH